ncbi:hypothetical protein M8J77_022071 [Diaphorina citri]|nr:hypothetical protein M8J77_022071 [Diaphorina citri]
MEEEEKEGKRREAEKEEEEEEEEEKEEENGKEERSLFDNYKFGHAFSTSLAMPRDELAGFRSEATEFS